MTRLLAILGLLLALCVPATATFYCVEEGNNYDAAGTADASLATACTTSGGFGWACDNATAGDVIAVIHGANSYDSGTASWTNRPADKSWEWDNTTCNAGTAASPIILRGYADTSTPCDDNPTATNCPVHLDFTGGTGDGMGCSNAGCENWIVTGFHVDNANSAGINWPAQHTQVIYNKVTGFGTDGIQNTKFVAFNHIDGESTATGKGIALGANAMAYSNRIEDMDQSTSAIGIDVGNESNVVGNIIVNSGIGIEVGAIDKFTILFNTVKDCSDDCLQATNGAFEGYIIGNIFEGATNDGIDLAGGAGAVENFVLICNQYDNNTANDKNTSNIETDLFEITGTTPTYDAEDTDLTLTNPQVCSQIASAIFGPGTNEELDLPIGAAYRDEDLPGAGGGGGTTVFIRGVR